MSGHSFELLITYLLKHLVSPITPSFDELMECGAKLQVLVENLSTKNENKNTDNQWLCVVRGYHCDFKRKQSENMFQRGNGC